MSNQRRNYAASNRKKIQQQRRANPRPVLRLGSIWSPEPLPEPSTKPVRDKRTGRPITMPKFKVLEDA